MRNSIKLLVILVSVGDYIYLGSKFTAQESMVLLRNDGTLPINFGAFKSVALIGPCADDPDCNTGDYNPQPAYIVTPRAAFLNRSGLTVNYASGCADVKCTSSAGFASAVTTARSSDFVVYVGGISHTIEGEGHDRANIFLPGLQSDLITMLVQVGKPVVVVLTHGAPVVSPVYASVNAVLSAGYAGQEAGNAVYAVLTGLYNPAGHTVVTWYTNGSQLPAMTNYSMVNRTYRYMTATPLYKFGYGLSYTKFNYSHFQLSPQTDIKPCDSVEMKVTVTNIGSVVGSEVVQFYATLTNSPVTTAHIKLVGFNRVENLSQGAHAVVTVSMDPSQMTVIYDFGNVPMIVPGEYQVYAGGSQPNDHNSPSNVLSLSFTITGDPIPLSNCTSN
ncbi:Probable exo-1,4-beta-xylosidase xlnD [Geodia barretti]|uniref:Probable exo-1,4-beta-xylosidase xlnD n=1 Tax=Geodia barretti TaxID=519541 RepID=A0AA35WRS8_GEOBA|nr:Probable exo-1,4-beta-xylosidase xlnD [Geodia barretti]